MAEGKPTATDAFGAILGGVFREAYNRRRQSEQRRYQIEDEQRAQKMKMDLLERSTELQIQRHKEEGRFNQEQQIQLMNRLATIPANVSEWVSGQLSTASPGYKIPAMEYVVSQAEKGVGREQALAEWYRMHPKVEYDPIQWMKASGGSNKGKPMTITEVNSALKAEFSLNGRDMNDLDANELTRLRRMMLTLSEARGGPVLPLEALYTMGIQSFQSFPLNKAGQLKGQLRDREDVRKSSEYLSAMEALNLPVERTPGIPPSAEELRFADKVAYLYRNGTNMFSEDRIDPDILQIAGGDPLLGAVLENSHRHIKDSVRSDPALRGDIAGGGAIDLDEQLLSPEALNKALALSGQSPAFSPGRNLSINEVIDSAFYSIPGEVPNSGALRSMIRDAYELTTGKHAAIRAERIREFSEKIGASPAGEKPTPFTGF